MRAVGNLPGLLAGNLRRLADLLHRGGRLGHRRRRLCGARGELRGRGGNFIRRGAEDVDRFGDVAGEPLEGLDHRGEGSAEHVLVGLRLDLHPQVAVGDFLCHARHVLQ